jgi:hypothetical protein
MGVFVVAPAFEKVLGLPRIAAGLSVKKIAAAWELTTMGGVAVGVAAAVAVGLGVGVATGVAPGGGVVASAVGVAIGVPLACGVGLTCWAAVGVTEGTGEVDEVVAPAAGVGTLTPRFAVGGTVVPPDPPPHAESKRQPAETISNRMREMIEFKPSRPASDFGRLLSFTSSPNAVLVEFFVEAGEACTLRRPSTFTPG